MLKLKNTLLTKQWIKGEVKMEIRQCVETNGNKQTTCQDVWDASKAVLRGRFLKINIYIKKEEISQIDNLMLQHKKLEKEE